ncbi:sensor histidine kinase [Carboxylicivirga sp. RSCT41]|uniref:sensor histidine kinase n=1 Tax=Carboxylicivirga agarovorans TaxID=3417570 RepID=UPI003D34C286
MEALDSKAVISMMFIGQTLSIIIFSYYLISYRNVDSQIKIYTIGKGLQAFGPLLSLLFADDLNPLIMALTVIFFYPGIAIEAYCLVYFKQKKATNKLILLLSASALALIIYMPVSDNVMLRVIVSSVYYSFIFFFIFIKSVLPRGNTNIQRLVGCIALLIFLINIARGLSSAFSSQKLELFAQELPQTLFLLAFVIVSFTFPLLFLLILQERNMQKLHELNMTKDKIFKIIGHDLRAPICQMVQFSELLEDSFDKIGKKKLIHFIRDLNTSSIRSFYLLENLLNWALSNTGQLHHHPEDINIKELINDNVMLLNKQAADKQITISVNAHYSGTIIADRNMLGTVIRNLLSNAIKFTYPKGTIEVHCTNEADKLRLDIRDSGMGISQESMASLFNVDNNQTSLGTNNERGTGIGLILCKEFIHKHSGSIWAESEPGKGSTFSFLLPLSKVSKQP